MCLTSRLKFTLGYYEHSWECPDEFVEEKDSFSSSLLQQLEDYLLHLKQILFI